MPFINEDTLQRRSSVIVSHLQNLEKQFFDLVDIGNVPAVRHFLTQNPNFNINVTDFQGTSALHIAVRNKNIAMVEYLLSSPEIDPGDTHLHAIVDNELQIVTLILNSLNKLSPGLEYVGVTQSTDFPDNATPLEVAAQCGHFELINFLRKRHHTIPKPHPPNCNCEECKSERDRSDLLTMAKMRLFSYKAITNPAYICQTVDDPILEAFNLSYELSGAASFDREFYHEYINLAKDISEFATELIGCARTIEEVEIILKQTTGFAISSKFVYPRLLFALHYEQKSFVAHPNVQQLIESNWIKGWYEWKIMSMWLKIPYVLWRIFMLPVIFVFLVFAPNSNYSKFYQSPVNKFISSSASYLVFLFIVFLQSNADKTEQLRGAPDTVYVWFLMIYVIGYTWEPIRVCLIHGPRRFFSKWWYWFDLVMLSLYHLTFLFWIAAAIDVRIKGDLELERKYWHKYDPTLIAEGLFALATIMAFMKLLHICQLNYHLGPLQLSLGEMIFDVLKFTIIFTIILLAFTTGTCKLYQYYDGMVQVDDESKIKTQQANSFVSFVASLKVYFWALFCMSPIESADVIIENIHRQSDQESVINYHTFTETIGYIAFAGYTFIAVILILNMLIACMSNTLTQVTENMIVEWTFGRTEAYVDYMLTTTLPSPFNIIPTYVGIQPIIEYVKIFLNPPKNKRARWDINKCCFIESSEKDKDHLFHIVMSQLVQRYFRKKEKQLEENDIDRLRKEIVDLRALLRDALTPE